MIIYKNEIINTNNITFIKECPKAISIHFIGGTNHWIFFEDERSKIALLTSLKFNMK